MKPLTPDKLCDRSPRAKGSIKACASNKSKSQSGWRFGSGLPHSLQNGWNFASVQLISSSGSQKLLECGGKRSATPLWIRAELRLQSAADVGALQILGVDLRLRIQGIRNL